jgi:hypothetical protein
LPFFFGSRTRISVTPAKKPARISRWNGSSSNGLPLSRTMNRRQNSAKCSSVPTCQLLLRASRRRRDGGERRQEDQREREQRRAQGCAHG